MTKQIAFILIVMLRILFNPFHDQKRSDPFASPAPLSTSTIPAGPGEVIRTNSNERLIKKWVIGDNRPGLCYNSSNVRDFIKEGAAETFFFASNRSSTFLQKNKS